MIFVSMPYRAEKDELVEERIRKARSALAYLMDQGYLVQCPVVAFHETIQQEESLSQDYKDWERMIEEMIVLSTKLVVLKLDGFEKSEGVNGEIEFAKKYNRDIIYLELENIKEEISKKLN